MKKVDQGSIKRLHDIWKKVVSGVLALVVLFPTAHAILDGNDVNATDDKGRTALMYAARFGGVEMVEKLLSCPDIDVNKKDYYGRTALMYAIVFGNVDVVERLLSDPRLNK